MTLKAFFGKLIDDYLKNYSFSGLIRYAIYLFVVLVFQEIVITHFRISGVCAFILPAAAVAGGMFAGPSKGAIFALFLGFFADMAFTESLVLFTILFPLIAFGAAFVAEFFVNRHLFAYMCTTFGALLITGAVQALRVFVFDGFTLSVIPTILLQTILSLPFAFLTFIPPARWYR